MICPLTAAHNPISDVPAQHSLRARLTISRPGNTKQHLVPTSLQELQNADGSMDGILGRDGSCLCKPEVLSRMSSLDAHILKRESVSSAVVVFDLRNSQRLL